MSTAASGCSAFGLGDNFVKQPEDTRQVLDYLSQSDHSDLIGVDDQVASGLLHLLRRPRRKTPAAFLHFRRERAELPSISRRKVRPKLRPPR